MKMRKTMIEHTNPTAYDKTGFFDTDIPSALKVANDKNADMRNSNGRVTMNSSWRFANLILGSSLVSIPGAL